MAETLKFGNGTWATKKGSTLAYNDEDNNFKPLPFTFDRSTSATRVNKEGLIEVVSNNEPRIDFLNDSKGALLLEPSRSNLLTYSEDFTQWSKSSATTTETSSAISTFGNYSLFETTALGGSISLSASVSGVVTFSIYAKKGTAKAMRIRLDASVDANCWVNLENGTEVGTNTGQSLEITDVNNGFYRIAFTANLTSLSIIRLYTTEATTTADEVGNIYVYGAQLEQGSYATSYIPTQGSIGTRVAESCSQTVPDGIIGQTEGTVFLDSKMALQSINNHQLFSINNGGGSDRIRILTATGNRLRFIYQLDGGTLFYNFYNPTDYGDLTNLKIAFTYKSGDIKVYINGVLADSSTNTFTIAEKLIDIDIASSTGGYNQMLFNDIKLYNTALTDQELQALTTI